MAKTWDTQIERVRQNEREALALRREIARQAATPEGVAFAEKERLTAEYGQLNQRLGAQAMIEARKIQAANPTIPDTVAFNLAAKGLGL